MGKKGFILCVCQGTCPSFNKMDIFGVRPTCGGRKFLTMSVFIRNSV